MDRTRALIGSFLFLIAGTGLEAGLGPWLLTAWHRGSGALDNTPTTIAGVALLAASVVVIVSCFSAFISGTGTPSPLAPPQTLVKGFAYRHVRNPMYVATAAAIAAQGLLLARPVLLAGAVIYLAAMALLVARVEEPLLRKRFGADFDAYCEAVPGWLPRPRSARW